MKVPDNKRLALLWVVASIFFPAAAKAESIDPTAYMATEDGSFGIVDLKTGSFTPVGNTAPVVPIFGLGVANGTLYAADPDGMLYTVNTSSGTLTVVGDTGLLGTGGLSAFGSTLTGLYALDWNANLYSIDPATGQSTEIGTGTGITIGDFDQLSTGSNTLYFANSFNQGPDTKGDPETQLWALDTSTGQAANSGNPIGITDGAEIGALVAANTTLYGGVVTPFTSCAGDCGCTGDNCGCGESGCGCDSNCGGECPGGCNEDGLDQTAQIFLATFDSSGTATINATVTGFSGNDGLFEALAPTDLSPSPEPSTGLLTIAATGFGFWLRRRTAGKS